MSDLSGARVLLVEDEAILALSIEDMLLDLGCEIVGPAMSLSQARALAEGERLDAAILDINMGEGLSFDVAATLRKRSVPFCFSTGYGSAGVTPEYAEVPVLPKPYSAASLRAVLSGLIDGR